MHRIEYSDGTVIRVYRVRGQGQLKWGWADKTDGREHLGTHLDCARDYAQETGGRFILHRVKREAKPSTPGYPAGLARLLRGR